jgi:hypothetical protein
VVNLLVSRTAVRDADVDPHAMHLVNLGEWSHRGHWPFHGRAWTVWEQYLTNDFGVSVRPATGRLHRGIDGWGGMVMGSNPPRKMMGRSAALVKVNLGHQSGEIPAVYAEISL